MPITQDRFLLTLRGAKAILDKQRNLMQVTEDAEHLISAANGAMEHISDESIKHALSPMFGLVNTLTNIVRSTDLVYIDLLATVLAELKHFDKAKMANARAAKLQRDERERKGIKPRLDFLRGEQLAPSMTPTLQPLFLDGTIIDKSPKPKVPMEQTQDFKNFEERMKKMRKLASAATASAASEEKANG